MQTKKANKKLSLNRVTVSCLSDGTLGRVRGGEQEIAALRTRYTACNNEERKAIGLTGFSSVDACMTRNPVCQGG